MTGTTGAAANGRAAIIVPAAALFATTLFWGSMVPFISELLRFYDPFLLSAARYLLAGPALIVCTLALERQWSQIRYAPWGRASILGAAVAGFATLYTLGIMFSNPVTAAVVLALNPVIAALAARVMGRASIAPGLFLAILLAVCGGIIVALGGKNVIGMLDLRGGEALIVLGMTCWFWYSMQAQTWLGGAGMSALAITAVSTATASIWLVVAYGALNLIGLASLPAAAPPAWTFGMLAWVGLGAAGLAIVFWNFGVARLGVTVAALYINLTPVVTILILAGFGHSISALQLLGGAIVLAGVVQMQIRQLRAADRAMEEQRQRDGL